MTGYIRFILVVFILSGCCSQSNSKPEVSRTKKIVLSDTIHVSNRFRMLWKSIAASTNDFETIGSYIPSESQISQFGLNKKSGQYFVSGFLKLSAELPEKDASGFSGLITKYSPNLYSFNIPLSKLPEIIKIHDIVFIDLSVKASIRK